METENLQNPATDTVEETETVAEQGTVVENTEDTTKVETEQTEKVIDKEAQKAEMRENQLKNIEATAKELEEEVGMPLADLVRELRAEEPEQVEEVVTPTPVVPQLPDEKWEKLLKAAEKLDVKEAVEKLPSDYRDFEKEIGDYLKENPILAQTHEGIETAYYAVKGKNVDKIAQTKVKETEATFNEKEKIKDTAFVEGAKHSESPEAKEASTEELLNLSPEEWSKLPESVRQQVLQSLEK